MPIAPAEYIVITFPGNQFKGEIAPAIAKLVESGTVHILDLVFVKKDADGAVSAFEFDDLPEGAAFSDIDGDADGLFSDADIEAAADALEPSSSALFIMWEDLWAAELGEAIDRAGGELLLGERIPRQAIEAALASAAQED
jgi:uncharacterized membrane protein